MMRIGIDMGGTKIEGIALAENGEELFRKRIDTPRNDYNGTVKAISNIVDRALNDYVLDFIHLQYNNYYWPAFNFADIYITIGVLLILYKAIIDLKKYTYDKN